MAFHPAKKTKASLFQAKRSSKEDQTLAVCRGRGWKSDRSLHSNGMTTVPENGIDKQERRRNEDVNKPAMLGNFSSRTAQLYGHGSHTLYMEWCIALNVFTQWRSNTAHNQKETLMSNLEIIILF